MNNKKVIKEQSNPTISDLSAHFKIKNQSSVKKREDDVYGGKNTELIDEKELNLKDDVGKKYENCSGEEDIVIKIQED